MKRNKGSQPQPGTFAALHSKCMHGETCVGPGCKRTRTYNYSTAAPRQRDTPTKPERRLAARIKGWEQSQQNGFKPEHGQVMHKPGSQNK